MSAHLQWIVVRNCPNLLIKRNMQTSSTGPNNLKACNSFGYHRLIHRKTVSMEPVTNGKSAVVIMKWRSSQRKLATSYVWTIISKNNQPTLSSIGT